MQLHSFFNSSTSYRVRIALALKGLPYDYVPVDIRTGAHRAPGFLGPVSDVAGVPVLVDGDVHVGQSLAIIDWLDGRHPEPRLIPAEPLARARVLELSYLVACDIHPVNNLRVLKHLGTEFGIDQAGRDRWYAHWIAEGMAAAERLLVRHGGGAWCLGDTPTMADCCLVPQVFNAIRNKCDIAPYPRAMAVYGHATAQPAFIAAAPANQPDFG